MSFFDRFSSKKGKESKAAPRPPAADAADKKAFAAVPSGQEKEAVQVETKAATPKPTDAKQTTPLAKEAVNGPANHIIVRPLVTEKSSRLNALRQYVFEVQLTATKIDVKNAVHQLYGVRPVGVDMINLRGQVVRYGRTWGKTNRRRKAMVTLPEGQSIDVFST